MPLPTKESPKGQLPKKPEYHGMYPALFYALLKQEILIYTDNLYSFSKISCTYTVSNYDHLKERIHITDKIWSNKERLF